MDVAPQPLILGTVNVPILGHAPPFAVPRIQPEDTTLPSHLTSHKQELSLKVPWASIKKLNGALAAGAVPDGVGGGLNPYGPPLSMIAFKLLRNVHVISSHQLPLPVMITCSVPGVVTMVAVGVGFTVSETEPDGRQLGSTGVGDRIA